MLLSDIGGALRRRWVLSLVCLALTLVGVGVGIREARPTYQSEATVLLLPPNIPRGQVTTGPDFTHGNPLFYLTGLDQTRDVLIGSLTSRQSAEALGRQFPGATYQVAPDLLGSAAVLSFTVKSGSAAETNAALAELLALVPRQLALVQEGLGVKPSAQITSHALARDPNPSVSHKSQIRRGIEVGAGLGLLCLFVIGGVDSILLTLRRRAGREAGGGPGDDVDGPSPSDRAPEGGAAPPAATEPVVTPPEVAGWPRGADRSEVATHETADDEDEPDSGETSSGNVRPLTKLSRGKRPRGPMAPGRQAPSGYRGRTR